SHIGAIRRREREHPAVEVVEHVQVHLHDVANDGDRQFLARREHEQALHRRAALRVHRHHADVAPPPHGVLSSTREPQHQRRHGHAAAAAGGGGVEAQVEAEARAVHRRRQVGRRHLRQERPLHHRVALLDEVRERRAGVHDRAADEAGAGAAREAERGARHREVRRADGDAGEVDVVVRGAWHLGVLEEWRGLDVPAGDLGEGAEQYRAVAGVGVGAEAVREPADADLRDEGQRAAAEPHDARRRVADAVLRAAPERDAGERGSADVERLGGEVAGGEAHAVGVVVDAAGGVAREVGAREELAERAGARELGEGGGARRLERRRRPRGALGARRALRPDEAAAGVGQDGEGDGRRADGQVH
ncbi:Os07g0532932, partial [Oryza sativa Japonica Group]